MITPQQGIVIAGRYTLVRPLAHGGMGSVWIAHHRDLEVDVTVKFMASSLVADADARVRFEREAKVLARLRSQHVVQVHDYGVEADTPYIVMELLRGESLAARLARDKRLALPDVARLVIQICKALRTAHEAGLVHRDLKPGNIFLAQKDEDEVVKVLDFGIAKAKRGIGEAQADTGSGVMLGSIHYMSPEQIRSSRMVDHRSDLWSVGVILYRMLTGRLPFPGATQVEVLLRVVNDVGPPPPVAVPDLPARIDDFFARALARDPNQRFQSAQELPEAFCTMALNLPAQSPTPPVSGVSNEVTRDDTTRRMPPPERTLRPALNFAAEELTIAASPAAESEITLGSIRAVLVSDPQAKQALQGVKPPVGKKWDRGRASLAAASLATVVVLAWILRMDPYGTLTEPMAIAVASPAVATVVAPVASATPPEITAQPTASPTLTAQSSSPRQASAPSETPTDVTPAQAPAGKPKVPLQAPKPPSSAHRKPTNSNTLDLEKW